MRNNVSTKKKALRASAIFAMLVICFVFVFAFTLSVTLDKSSSGTAHALTGTNGVTTQIYGNHGDIGALDMSSAGFPGASSGTTSWSFSESFSNIAFSLASNISIAEIKDANYTFTGGTGNFSWNASDSGTLSYNDVFVIINYKVPTFIKNILGNSGITVKVTFSATVNRSSGGGSGIFMICSDKSTSAGEMDADKRDKYTTVSNVTLASNVAVLSLGFYGYESFMNKGSNVSVSNISVQFNVSMSNPSDSDSKSIYDGSAPVVAEEYNSVGTANSYAPYLTSAATASTWPVWYSSIESTLNKALDSVENGAGKLQSYTSAAKSVNLTNTSGTSSSKTYYKYSQVEFVDTYDYSFDAAFTKLTKDNITVANFKKVAGLGDKFLSSYNSGTGVYTWTSGDSNYRYAAGIKTVQVGESDGTSGAIFNLYDATNVDRYKEIIVGGQSVGYAVVTKTNRSRIIVKTYMFANAKVTTKVTDYGGQSISKSITFSGIDTTNPVAPSMSESDYLTATGTANAINAISWLRSNTFTNEVAQNIDNDPTNGQASFSPYLWFYVVDKEMTAAAIASKAARTYANYSAIKTANLTPIACGNFTSFKYDFVNGEATGIGGTKVGNAASIGACTGSGYYRFTFFTVDLSGRMCTSTSVCYVKVDVEAPTFSMGIDFCYDEEYDAWDEITKSQNGKWATGETIVTLSLASKGARYVNNNSTNISGNTLVFDAGSDTYAIVFDSSNIVSINGTAVNAQTFTFDETTLGKIQTLASEVKLKVTYSPGGTGTPAHFEFEFPELKSTGAQNQVFPNIDWTTVFTIYAGTDYQTDNVIYATDGWTGGVKILVDKNRPQTPTLSNDDDFIISALGLFDDNIGDYTLEKVVTRNWFTATGLTLDAELAFSDDMTEIYGDAIKVYIGIRTIKSDEDFNTYNDLPKSVAYFADNYKELSVASYDTYFRITPTPSGSLDGSETDIAVNLVAADNAGLRVIFVWAVDQAGNVSGLSQYYVLADANTYTINSSVKLNEEIAGNSAHIVQKDAEDNEGVKQFKRGDVVTFVVDMNTNDDNYTRYAPYTFKKTDGAGESLVLFNYSSDYEWNIVSGFGDNISLDNSSYSISYIVDDFSRVDALNTVNEGSTKKISFEFAHREIVTYTVTNWQSAYTGVDTVVTMSVSNDSARAAFEYYYLDYSLNHIATPRYPNTELAPNYFVAIFIPTDNPNYVVQSNNRQIVSDYAAVRSFGYVASVDGAYKLANGEYVELTEQELIDYEGTRYARPLDVNHMENVKLHFGYQKVDFAVYKIGKGSAVVKAIASSTRYGDSVTLDYILQIGANEYTSTEAAALGLSGVALELYTTATAPYTTCSIGSYTIIQTGEMNLEYFTVDYESAIHTINTRPISIVVLADSKIYGNADPDFRFSVNLSEFGSESALTAFFAAFGEYTKDGNVYTYYSKGAVRRANGENAGEYAYTANNAAFDVDTNYSLNIDITSNVFSITKRTITLIANGQSIVKLASDHFNESTDWATIFPTYTLSNADLPYANEIVGHLAIDSTPVVLGGNEDYDYRYQYDVTLGTIIDTNNLHFVLDNPSVFFVYVAYAETVVVKLRANQAFNFVYGTAWASSLIEYSYEMFEGLEEGCTVTWTASLSGAGAMPDAGSYRVILTNVVAHDATDNVIDKVVVEAFNVTFDPAVIVVAPTYSALKKGYGDVESTFGIGFEIVSVGGKIVGSGEGEISEYAGYEIAEIKNNISGAFARALFSGNNMLALGTRYDDASDANGVLYSDDSKHYGFALSTKFSVSDANFTVDSTLSDAAKAIRFEIERHTITVSRTALVGVDKVIDNTSVVNYRNTQVADLRSKLVLSTDDVQIDYIAHYVDKDDVTVEQTTEGRARIAFDFLGLKGEQAANYILYINPSDLDPTIGKIVIAYHDNLNNTTSIRISTGSIAIANKDYVTISKQYDGTTAISASDVRIADYTDDSGVGTKILCNLLDSARVVSGVYGGAEVNANYVLSIELFFPISTNKDDLDRFTIEADENATDVEISASENAYGGYYGIVVKIDNQKAAITKREINAKSFVTNSLVPVTRDYNSLDTVEVKGTFTDTALVAGDSVKLTMVGVINDTNYNVDGKKTGTFAIRFDSYEINNSNYIVNIDNLNATYAGDKALKVTINRAKLLPNYSFEDKVYDGTANVTATPVAGYDFTTVNYPTELSAELATFTLDGVPTFALSKQGQQNGNVTIEGDKVVAHDVLVSGLKVLGDATLLKNYEIFGYRYANGDYVAVGTVPATVVADYEILKVVEVEKRQIIVDENHINVHDKIYDGTKDAGASIRVDNETNIVPADQSRLILGATGEFAQKQVGDKIEVKISNITLSVVNEEDAYLINNYKVGTYSGAIIEKKIYERPVTFTTTLGTKVYSGDMAVSNNVINYKFSGFLGNDGNTYGIQTKGGAYYFDKNASKNLFIEDVNGTYKLDDKGNYVTLTTEERTTYTGTRYSVNFDKQGTVYNPTLMNTKAHYMNYKLTQSVSKAEYDGTSEYYACELENGEFYHFGDPRIDDTKVVTYYFALQTAQKYIEVAKTNKYILASNDAWVDAARTAGALIVEQIEDELNPGTYLPVEKTFHVDGQLVYLVDKTYAGDISGTLTTPVAYKDAKYHQAELDNAFIGFFVYNDGLSDKDIYFVTDAYTGAYETTAEPMTYSNDAYGRIRKKVAVISDVIKLNDDVFIKKYDGTTKFYGVAGLDYSYNEDGIGLDGDDLYIVGVVAKFEKSSVGTVYVSFEAESLGGADADNYSYGSIRSARIDGRIEKRTIDAFLNDGEMVYGTNYISGVDGDVTYTLEGKALYEYNGNLFIKVADFIEVVGLDPVADAEYVEELTKYTYNKLEDGSFERIEGAGGEYRILSGNITLPTAKPKFSVTRPSAGSTSTVYTLVDGEASNFEFAYSYTDDVNGKSVLSVRQKDLYIVADVKDYQKDYAGEDPAITLNYVDLNGNSAFASGETWQNAFGKKGEYLPVAEFWLFDEYGNPVEKVTDISKVNDGNDLTFAGNYVLVLRLADGFDAASSNYNVHCGDVELVNLDAQKNARYRYSYAGAPSFAPYAPELTINLPTISGIYVAVTAENDYALTTTYKYDAENHVSIDQTGLALTGVKSNDDVFIIDANGNEVHAAHAGVYQGVIAVRRNFKANENDTNNYSAVWRSDVNPDVKVTNVKITVEKASPMLFAKAGSITYDGFVHEYNTYNVTVGAADLETGPEFYTLVYKKKVGGDLVTVSNMKDAGSYTVYITYDSGNPDYLVETYPVQYSIIPATVTVRVSGDGRFFYSEDGFVIDFSIEKLNPSNVPIGKSDMFVQILLGGKSLFKVNEYNRIVPVGDAVSKDDYGHFHFKTSGKYAIQIVLKDASQEGNYNIVNGAGNLELVVSEIDFAPEGEVQASLVVADAENLDAALLADTFEAKYLYDKNDSAEDDLYFAQLNSNYYLGDIEKAYGTSASVFAAVKLQLTCNGNKVALNGTQTKVSIELTQDILDRLDSIVIYTTVTQSDNTVKLQKLTNYEIKDGVLSYETTELGSIVFVRIGRDTPMTAIWISVGVAGGVLFIVGITAVYIMFKRKKLKKMMLE